MDSENKYHFSVQENHIVPMSSKESDTDLTFLQEEILEPLKPIKTIATILFNSTHSFNFFVKASGFMDSANHSDMMISEKEMFFVFSTLKPECTNILISKLDCPLFTKSDMMVFIQNKDYNGFYKFVRNNNCDLTCLERLCNVLLHCISFYNDCKELVSDTIDKLKNGVELDDVFTNLIKELVDKGRDTLIAILNNRDEAYQVASKIETRLLELIDDEETTHQEEERNEMSPDSNEPFLYELTPYMYALFCNYLNLSEREKIESCLKILIPSITFVAMDDNTINTGLREISEKYPEKFFKVFSDNSFEDGLIHGLLIGARVDDHTTPMSIEDSQNDSYIEQQKRSDGNETNEDRLDADAERNKARDTKHSKSNITYKVKSLGNKGAAETGTNFQWSDELKKWYGEHDKKFAAFVKYVAKEKGYIPNEQSQVNAFIRTLTGRDVRYCSEKVKLLNNARNDATRAMMYLVRCGIIKGRYADIFTCFDVERPTRYQNSPDDTGWMSGYARDAEEEFKSTVHKLFADYTELKIPKDTPKNKKTL